MSVSVDTRRFRATPFDVQDGIFRICFAGRLDEFKDPPLMFDVLARLHAKLEGKIEFHYVGATDPARYPEFAKGQAFTLRHGSQTPDGVRDIMARCHAGILTSYFEGLPCYLLEMLASGRPVGAIDLPQYKPLILPGISGALIPRSEPREKCAEALANAFASLWQRGAASIPCVCTHWSSRILWRHSSTGFLRSIARCKIGAQCRPRGSDSRRKDDRTVSRIGNWCSGAWGASPAGTCAESAGEARALSRRHSRPQRLSHAGQLSRQARCLTQARRLRRRLFPSRHGRLRGPQ